ncbi:mitochondrial metalloendopeptidase OMA1-like isoform X1 [Vicia villosa]|uniref:mitochondrial metalloendopeptidase OMA1-like isoform X1 n=1 Tax=Vicia villosa TaxID=3911 RepID=UPI00273CEEB9|nr:mitochondrial metalloendopeptidase OMA1-like isoform X1 [Vicia villosa]
MAWYRRGKLVVDGFHTLASRVSSQNSIFQPSSRALQSGYLNSRSKGAIFNGFSSFSSVSKRLGKEGFEVNKSFRRLYYVDPRNVQHFRARGPRRWIQNPRHVLIAVVVGSGVFVTVYFGNMETVPYTKRTHLILMSRAMERKLGESEFEKMKVSFKGKLLPAIHPESVRVRMIANEIVDALKRGLSKENVWSDLGYASENATVSEENGRETLSALTDNGEKVEGNWHREDEILDDNWVHKSRKKGSQPDTGHLDGLNWEILVVNEPVVNAFCLPGGKIVVFTGLLEHFRSDAEIATIIGHEVGHAVARHSAEGMTKNLWFFILQLVLIQFVTPDIVNTMSSLFLRLPFSRRMEIEADYIGILLLASAGYDPRVAPKVYEKLGKVTGESSLRDYLSTHPSGKKRAELLAQAQVMEEALTMYKNVRAGRGVEGFL